MSSKNIRQPYSRCGRLVNRVTALRILMSQLSCGCRVFTATCIVKRNS
jgi:hypothetical protein